MFPARRTFLRWTVAIAAGFAASVFAIDHFLRAGDVESARFVLYLQAALVPAAALSAWRHTRRVHFRLPPNDVAEVSVPCLVAGAIGAALWMISFAY